MSSTDKWWPPKIYPGEGGNGWVRLITPWGALKPRVYRADADICPYEHKNYPKGTLMYEDIPNGGTYTEISVLELRALFAEHLKSNPQK